MGRSASLVLVSPSGELLGMLPPVELLCPYWPESADVVAKVRECFAARVVVLRLLSVEPARKSGGFVTYLAELAGGVPSVEPLPIPEELGARARRPDPKRMPWAERGGPAQTLMWASGVLGGDFEAIQQRTWNLSSLWRLQPASGADPIWLKQAPHFMRGESAVLRWLNGAVRGSAPRLFACDDQGRSLLAHVEGVDLYDACVEMRKQINGRLHQIQCAGADAVAELLALGVPDWRGTKLGADIRKKLMAWSPSYPELERLLRSLDEQLERLDDCALPATLVHGDNHPGNARGSHRGVTLLDWGEAFVGSPVTDLLCAIGGLSEADSAPLKAAWCESWKRVAPDSQPALALDIAPFVGAMLGAATYAHFLAQIEESEWPYHRDDVPSCLQAAKELLTRVSS